ncbi:sce7726 family protein [Clostridium tertium]|uniref:sce7726 family protein n=1 Tax=Clostridium tertium TaxID=1559 RepID=UPI0018A95D56|nr:sce7726 family protein [Clostridium tertium]
MENNNIILNRIFTKTTFNSLIYNKDNTCYSTIVTRYLSDINKKSNKLIIRDLYKFMGREYRNEYYFKNTLINKLLLGKYSVNTTTALTEVPINKSKADFILVNNKAVVYEIKTSLDTLERLDTQLNDYFKAFTTVCVVTCESNYEKLNSLLKDTKVGIYILTDKNTLSKRKEPIEERAYLNYEVIFKILRKNEFENILLKCYGKLPSSTPAFYYDECFEYFKSIDIDLIYKYMLEELRKRIYLDKENYKNIIPYELKFLAYFAEYKEEDYSKLNKFLMKGFGD